MLRGIPTSSTAWPGLTAAQGLYSLTVNAADFRDQNGLAGTGILSISWLMDTTPPTSTVSSLPQRETSLSFPVSVTGSDGGNPAAGVASYAIDVSINGGSWALWTTVPASNPTATYTGQSNTTYAFYSIATDNAGNVETKQPAIEASTYLPNLTPPVTAVERHHGYQTQHGQYHDRYVHAQHHRQATPAAASSPTSRCSSRSTARRTQWSTVRRFRPGPPDSSGNSHATIPYQGLTDGSKHIYRFYSIGLDSAGNVQSAPSTPNLSIERDLLPTLGTPGHEH